MSTYTHTDSYTYVHTHTTCTDTHVDVSSLRSYFLLGLWTLKSWDCGTQVVPEHPLGLSPGSRIEV